MADRIGGWIITFSGQKFYPLDPHVDEIHPIDIAHALSLQCRWTGQIPYHYSVAQHCVLGADLLGKLHGPQIQLAFLLHDAGEAYLADVARPVKRDPRMAFYKEAEAAILNAIHQRFILPVPDDLVGYDVVHRMDNQLLMAEAKMFHPHMSREWGDWKEASEEKIRVDIQEGPPRVWETHFYGALHCLLQGKPFKLRQRNV